MTCEENEGTIQLLDPKDGQILKVRKVKKEKLLKGKRVYRETLLNEFPEKSIKVKNVGPCIFDVIIDYLETDSITNQEIEQVVKWIDLAVKSNRDTMDRLKAASADLLISSHLINKGNVWKILSENINVEAIASACEETLCMNAEELLKSPEFFQLELNVISHFLKLEGLRVDSEMLLVRACVAYNRQLKREVENVSFRKYFLPHLRLLTLTVAELSEIEYLLTLNEKIILVHLILEKEYFLNIDDLVKTGSIKRNQLCSERQVRYSGDFKTLEIVPDDEILDLAGVFRNGLFSTIKQSTSEFELSFVALKNIRIRRILMFTPVHLLTDDFCCPDVVKSLEIRQKERIMIMCGNFTLTCEVRKEEKLLATNEYKSDGLFE
ncbi:Hypothetical predicted protein [Cloeon dipterum]|nr:Hypothetical predicted protein [Cloeon dipterum]